MEDKKITILIVEDEDTVAFQIKLIVEKLGYKVLNIVKSGEDAIEFIKETTPDVILMDIQLDGEINGIEATEAINEIKEIPVIYVTIHSDRDIVEKAKNTRPYNYVIKPVKERELEIVIDIALYTYEASKKQKELIQTLERAIEEIKTLRGFIPICASCKKIRNDDGFWQKIEQYLSENTDAQFSHSLCPDCARKLYPTVDFSKKEG